MVNLRPVRGREQDGIRPALVLSVSKFNRGPAELVIVLQITKVRSDIPTHVPVPRGEAGLTEDSYITCEDIRSVSRDRLVRCLGEVTHPRIEQAQMFVRILLGL